MVLKKVFKALITNLATSKLLFRYLVLPIIKFGYFKNIKSVNQFVETELDVSRKEFLPKIYKTKPSPIQAALLSNKIDNVVKDNEIRIKFANLYYENLKILKISNFLTTINYLEIFIHTFLYS